MGMFQNQRLTDALMEAKRRAQLAGRTVSRQETAGITEGYAGATQGRALEEYKIGAQERQFGEQLAEQKRQFATTAGLKEREMAQTAGLAREQMGQQATLTREQMAQRGREFETTTGLTREQMAQRATEFEKTFGLNEQQFEEAKTQFGQEFALKADTLKFQVQQSKDQLAMAQADLAEKQRQFDAASETQKAQFGQQMQFQIQQAQEKLNMWEAEFQTGVNQFAEQMRLGWWTTGKQAEAAANADSGGCIIVTVCTSEDSGEVDITRQYRDRFLTPEQLRGYYIIAERTVPIIKRFSWVKRSVKRFLVDSLVAYGRDALNLGPAPGIMAKMVTKAFLSLCLSMGRKAASFVRSNGEVV